MVGAFAGARAAARLLDTAQLALLALVMLSASISVLRRPPRQGEADAAPVAPRPAALIPVAAGVGVLTGLLGVGGGFLVVPALALLARVPMRQAVGTSLVVIALNSASGVVGYLGVVPIDWAFLARFTAVAAAGALGGAAIIRLVPVSALRRSFAVLLLVVGTFLLAKNLTALGGADPASASPHRPATLTNSWKQGGCPFTEIDPCSSNAFTTPGSRKPATSSAASRPATPWSWTPIATSSST